MAQPDWYKPPAQAITKSDDDAAYEPRPEDTVGFWPRAAAAIVDMVAGFGLGMGTNLVRESLLSAGLPLPRFAFTTAESLALGAVYGLVQSTVFDAVGGAGLGKLVMGYRVRDRNGGPCGVGAAFKRSLAYYWDSLFFAIVAYRSMSRSVFNQRQGDRWARTIVVRNVAIPPGARRDQQAILGVAIGFGLTFVYSLLLGE